MRKGLIFGLVALFTIFAFVMVGCDTGTTKKDNTGSDTEVTITYSLGTGGPESGATAPSPVKIAVGGSLTTAQLAGPTGSYDKTKYIFEGWLNGTTEVTTATTFNSDTTITAKWEIVDPETQWLVTWNYNYTGAPESSEQVVAKANLSLDKPATDPTREGYVFKGWADSATGTTAVTFPVTTLTANPTYYAIWEAEQTGPTPGNRIQELLAEAADDGVYVERAALMGGAFSIYQFDIGENHWSDYSMITVDYLLDEDNFGKGIVNTRLYGAYTDITTPGADYNDLKTFGEFTVDANGAYVARQDGEANNSKAQNNRFHYYIWSQQGTNWAEFKDHNNSNITAAAEEWFTIEYPVVGKTATWAAPHANFNSQPGSTLAEPATGPDGKGNLPDGSYGTLRDTGKFWVGVGLSGGGSNESWENFSTKAVEQWIAKVTLVHATDPTKNIISTGSGLDKVDGKLAQVFVSYMDPIATAWRGAYDADVVAPVVAGYVPPDVVAPGDPGDVLFDLADWIDAYTGDGTALGAPLVNGGTIVVAVDTTEGTIAVSGRGANWAGLDIQLEQGGIGLLSNAYFDEYKIHLVVEGTTTYGAKMRAACGDSNYEIVAGGNDTVTPLTDDDGNAVTTDGALGNFKLEGDFPKNFSTTKLRIADDTNQNTEYTITSIVITYVGAWE